MVSSQILHLWVKFWCQNRSNAPSFPLHSPARGIQWGIISIGALILIPTMHSKITSLFSRVKVAIANTIFSHLNYYYLHAYHTYANFKAVGCLHCEITIQLSICYTLVTRRYSGKFDWDTLHA